MRKILIVTSSYIFIRGFLIPHIKHLTENGWEVHVASKNDGTTIPYVHKQIDIPIQRSPFRVGNLIAVNQLKKVIKEERYDIVHCHTPIGAMVARLAAKDYRKSLGVKVIYMTHGLHFYMGAKRVNWLLYFSAEKFLARYTDAIITINSEDCSNAKRYFPEIPHQYTTPGIGYDIKHVGETPRLSKAELRHQYGIKEDDFVCLYIARYTLDKNHKFLINSLKEIQKRIPKIKLMFVGDGEEMVSCRKLSTELGVEQSVIFAGYQLNITDYLHMADVGVSPSVCEGLGLGLVEEMCIALPIVASHVRGHRDLIEHGRNGLLYELNSTEDFVEKLALLHNNPEKAREIGHNAQIGIKKYAVENIIPMIDDIYDAELS